MSDHPYVALTWTSGGGYIRQKCATCGQRVHATPYKAPAPEPTPVRDAVRFGLAVIVILLMAAVLSPILFGCGGLDPRCY